jgi:hypothetical protein
MDCEDTITLTVQWENLAQEEDDKEEESTFGDSVVGGGASIKLDPTTSSSMSSKHQQVKAVKVVSTGSAVYTSSWVAPKSDVHSQQRFFYMGQVRVIFVLFEHDLIFKRFKNVVFLFSLVFAFYLTQPTLR